MGGAWPIPVTIGYRLTRIERLAEAMDWLVDACTTKAQVPSGEGTPAITPRVGLRLSPGGSIPPVTAHTHGAEALNVCE